MVAGDRTVETTDQGDMLQRIDDLLSRGVDFAFETTLATRSYVSLVKKAQQKGYTVTLLYFWLNSPQMAMDRVAARVSKGGHNIPADVIERRYYRGIKNLIDLYIPICDSWLVINSTKIGTEVIAQNLTQLGEVIINTDIWNTILSQSNDSEHK